jgi:hypothetical protein
MKKKYYLNIFLVPIIFVPVFILSCKSKDLTIKTTVSLKYLLKAQPDSFSNNNETLLNIIKVYPAQNECNATEKYANLYICSKVSSGDTVYVFEECREVGKQAIDTIHYYPFIDKENMTIPSSDKVTVFVPTDFKINTKLRYFSAKISFLLSE